MLWTLACGGDDREQFGTIVVAHQECIEVEGCVVDEKRLFQNRLIGHTNQSEVSQSVSIKVTNQGKCRFTVRWLLLGEPAPRDLLAVAAGETESVTAQIPPGRGAEFYWFCFSLHESECRAEVDIRIARPGDSTS